VLFVCRCAAGGARHGILARVYVRGYGYGYEMGDAHRQTAAPHSPSTAGAYHYGAGAGVGAKLGVNTAEAVAETAVVYNDNDE